MPDVLTAVSAANIYGFISINILDIQVKNLYIETF
jgi:hypothetical protein